jgi:GntR family transcriptional regulator
MEVQLHLELFTGDMRRRGHKPSTEMLSCAELLPPPATAAALGLEPTKTAYQLFRLRRADRAPLAVERGWYSRRKLPGLLDADLSGSVYTLMAEDYGIQVNHGRQTVWAESADQETARLLSIRTGSPVLVFRRISTADTQRT